MTFSISFSLEDSFKYINFDTEDECSPRVQSCKTNENGLLAHLELHCYNQVTGSKKHTQGLEQLATIPLKHKNIKLFTLIPLPMLFRLHVL